jgi:hypothetical protein
MVQVFLRLSHEKVPRAGPVDGRFGRGSKTVGSYGAEGRWNIESQMTRPQAVYPFLDRQTDAR